MQGARLAVVWPLALVLLTAAVASAGPWDLRSYEHCKGLRMRGIPAEASGVTFNPITNTIWVVTRRPRVLGEYSIEGKLIRTIDTSHARFRDPEGITWMYDYVFAIAQEGGPAGYRHSTISIVDASPWRDKVDIIRRIEVEIRQRKNAGLEALTYDPIRKVLLAGQEEDPMQIWAVDPANGDAEKVYTKASESKLMRDFASLYKRAGDEGIYILSEPSERVFKLDKDGNRVDDQVILVKGKMPEGVTFTADGYMMIIVGEPNEMFIYSSTGSCDYRPDPTLRIEQPSSSDPDSAAISAPIVTEGFCSYNECSGGAQGTDWCRADAHRCVGACGGWWCSKLQGVPPITPQNYVGPPPPAAPASPPSPPSPSPPPPPPRPPAWYADPEKGFCNFNDCETGPGGNAWCKASAENCIRCAGTWCPKQGVEGAEPLTANNFELPPASDESFLTQESEDELLDGGVADGYTAFMDVILDGVSDVNDSELGALREAVAMDLFGATQASVAVNASVKTDTRRQLAEGSAPAATMLTLEVLAETPEHANFLRNKFKTGVQSGSLVTILHSSYGMQSLDAVIVQESKVVIADIRPADYPTAVTIPTPEDQIPVVYMREKRQSASSINWVMVAGVAAGCVALTIVAAVVINFSVLKKKAGGCLNPSDSADAAEKATPTVSTAVELSVDSRRTRPPLPAGTSGHPNRHLAVHGHARHARTRSDASDVGLLAVTGQDTGSRDSTPCHSRNVSVNIFEGDSFDKALQEALSQRVANPISGQAIAGGSVQGEDGAVPGSGTNGGSQV